MNDEHLDFRGFKTGKRKMTNYRCYYKKEFLVDEYGCPDGLYSLVDIPIAKHDVLSRKGITIAKNSHLRMVQVRDVEHPTWEYWIPEEDVSLGEIIND